VKRHLQSYGILVLSLLALFASGIFIGRMTAPVSRQIAAPANAVPSDADAWVAAASGKLANDLNLDDAQRLMVRQQLDPVAQSIFADRERALFQIHLRLLELHDTLAKQGSLSDPQLKRLAASRTKLRELIIRTFPRQVRENPSLAISGKNQ
jgi:hypothetical protein